MKNSNRQLTVVLALAACTLSLALCAQAQTFTSLYSFCSQINCPGGYGVTAPLVQGRDGNLYGETAFGGVSAANSPCGGTGCGTIFKITPQGTITTIYSFCPSSSCLDGSGPEGGLVLSNDGNFYGVTAGGGATLRGTVFKITPAGKLTTLHSFDGTDGYVGQGTGLIQASNGNFYGTTAYGGAYDQGTVFEITPSGFFSSLYSFCATSGCPDGAVPNGLTQGSDGNIYGTTSGGGVTDSCNAASTSGTFFQLTPAGTLTTLTVFCRLTGFRPNSTLVPAANGNFYGTTADGGSSLNADQGTVYEMTPDGSITSLYSFCLQTNCPDGKTPIGLAMGTDGNFYGTTELANADNKGTIYEITPARQLTTLYSFTATNGNFLDGSWVAGPMLLHTNGKFYGVTFLGGKHGSGSIFSFAAGQRPSVRTAPSDGKVGKRVLILGNGLTGTTSVTFNGVAANFTVESDTYIKATVPAGATTGTVSVVTPSGTLNSNPEFVVTK